MFFVEFPRLNQIQGIEALDQRRRLCLSDATKLTTSDGRIVAAVSEQFARAHSEFTAECTVTVPGSWLGCLEWQLLDPGEVSEEGRITLSPERAEQFWALFERELARTREAQNARERSEAAARERARIERLEALPALVDELKQRISELEATLEDN